MRCDVGIMAAAIMAFGAIGSTAAAQQGSSTQQSRSRVGQTLSHQVRTLAAAQKRSGRGKPISAHTIYRASAARDGGLYRHAIYHGAWSILADCSFFPITMSLLR